jgi:monovalent cation:H+ antiporter-2, CPA2 family
MVLVVAAGAVPEYLNDVCVLLVVAAAVAYVCQRLGVVPIVGFLLAGVLIGPHATGLVRNQSVIEGAAELGVLLLLFTIGIEFSLEKLARITRLIVVGGGLQVVLVTGAVTAVLLAFGIDWRVGVFSGFLAALSSTAIVTKLLGDRGEAQSPQAQSALGVLIFQDLAVVPMVLLVPVLAGQGGSASEVAWTLAKAGLIIALVLVVARRVLPRVLETVARTCSPDLFLLTVIAICVGTAWLVGMAGVSIALGAFLAGLVVSESAHGEHALAEILPLQILFSATFFVSIGLLLDVRTLLANLPLVLLVASAVVVIKLLATSVALRAAGQALPVAGATALLVAQVGEFSFVLERSGRSVGLTPLGMGEAGSQAFIAATVMLMALTPLLASGATRLSRRLEGRERARLDELPPQPSPHLPAALQDHVVVAGYGRAARALVRVLRGSRIPFAIVTLSPDGAREAEAQGLPVLRGDYHKPRILELLQLSRAKLLVIPDDDLAMARRVVAVSRDLAPTTRIVVRAATRDDATALEAAGADRAIAAELEAIVGLFDDVLRNYAVPPAQILDHEATLRRQSYELFDPGHAVSLPCELGTDCFARRTLRIRAGTPLAGRRLSASGLERHGIRALRIDIGGEGVDDPPGETLLAVGAEITLAGTPEAFVGCAELFRRSLDSAGAAPPEAARGSTGAAAATSATGATGATSTLPAMTAPWVDTTTPIAFTPAPDTRCTHLDHIRAVTPSTPGCAECLASGGRWVHLRVCLECGHVGCCDSSPGRHATAHYRASGHPVMRSLQPGETWGWCHVDQLTL